MATPNESKFFDAWRALGGSTESSGWSTIPVSAQTKCLILAGRHHPRNEESMLIGFTSAGLPKSASLPRGRGFTVDPVEISIHGVHYFCLAVTRQASANLDLFCTMLDDLVSVLEQMGRSESEQISAVIDRISGWQKFMSREDDGVLSPEAETGLLGELRFLRSLIQSGTSAPDAVGWWQGPSDSLHDFVCPRGDVEVKSSTQSGAFSAYVAELDQLDETLVQPLYLAAVQFTLSPTGLTLPDHIDQLRTLISADDMNARAFEGKLLDAGYHQALASRYHRRFSYLLTSLYEVTGLFPRLTKGAVPAGVISASYRIGIDSTKYSPVPLKDVLQRIG